LMDWRLLIEDWRLGKKMDDGELKRRTKALPGTVNPLFDIRGSELPGGSSRSIKTGCYHHLNNGRVCWRSRRRKSYTGP